MPAFYNTKEKGYIHYIVYKEDREYVAVCLDFGLVEYGLDHKELEKSIVEAAFSYLDAVRKKNLPDEYLNLPVEKKYIGKLKEMEMASELERRASKKRVPVPKTKQKLTYFTNTKAPYYRDRVIA